jgi:hypothetical protein
MRKRARSLREPRPHLLDRRQAQIGEEELDARSIDGIGGLAATRERKQADPDPTGLLTAPRSRGIGPSIGSENLDVREPRSSNSSRSARLRCPWALSIELAPIGM